MSGLWYIQHSIYKGVSEKWEKENGNYFIREKCNKARMPGACFLLTQGTNAEW